MIWKHAAQEPKTIHVRRITDSMGPQQYFSPTPPPAILSVCSKSREEALRYYQKVELESTIDPYANISRALAVFQFNTILKCLPKDPQLWTRRQIAFERHTRIYRTRDSVLHPNYLPGSARVDRQDMGNAQENFQLLLDSLVPLRFYINWSQDTILAEWVAPSDLESLGMDWQTILERHLFSNQTLRENLRYLALTCHRQREDWLTSTVTAMPDLAREGFNGKDMQQLRELTLVCPAAFPIRITSKYPKLKLKAQNADDADDIDTDDTDGADDADDVNEEDDEYDVENIEPDKLCLPESFKGKIRDPLDFRVSFISSMRPGFNPNTGTTEPIRPCHFDVVIQKGSADRPANQTSNVEAQTRRE